MTFRDKQEAKLIKIEDADASALVYSASIRTRPWSN